MPLPFQQWRLLKVVSENYHNLGSLRAETRHIMEKFSVMGTPSLQPFLKSYWLTPVQMTGQLSRMQIMTSSRQYKCRARNNYVRIWYWTPISWTSSDHGDYRDSRSRSQGTEFTIVTGDVPYRAFTLLKLSVMGMIFNPAVREARGSLYKLHTSEIEHTSFPPIAALIGRAHSWLVEISQWASKPQVYLICIFGQCLQSSGKVSVLTQPGPSLNHHSTRKADQIAESCPNGQCKSSVIVHLP